MSRYLSKDFPVLDQTANRPCEWCGGPLGESPHGHGTQCHAAHVAFSEAEMAAGQLELAAAILRRKACVFGEEPLQGALERAKHAVAMLEKIRETARKARPPIPGAFHRTEESP